MNESRNLLYEIKKRSDVRSSPFYNPVGNEGEMDLRDELRQLRQINRIQETQLIRVKEQMNQMRAKIIFYQQQLISQEHEDQRQSNTLTKQLTTIPIVLQTKELKIQLQHTHQVNLQINGKNRQLQQKNRELESQLAKCTKKIKEMEILYQIRIENAERELQEARNRTLEQDSHECKSQELNLLTQSTKKIIQFIRQHVLSVSYQLFATSAKQCENEKKTNSYKVFVKQWNELTKQKHLGYMALVQSLKSLQQIESLIKFDKEQIFDLSKTNQPYRDTLNEWIINTLTEIRHTKKNDKLMQQKLFRLLGLYYRSNFPIQGQLYELDEDVKNYFSKTVCEEIYSLIIID